jgi:hypothetical protein
MTGDIAKDSDRSAFGLMDVPSWQGDNKENLMEYLPNRIPQHFIYIKSLGHMLFKAEL